MKVMSYITALTIALSMAGIAAAAPMFSSQERAEGLLAGRGMGLATPAENHGYPGPRHVLDAANVLGLTAEQKEKTTQIVAAMSAEAIPAAKHLLADEAALDQLFIDHKAVIENITAASDQAARDESVLRVIHLKYHLAMMNILTPEQVQKYIALGSHVESNSHSGMHGMPGMMSGKDMNGMDDHQHK